MPLNTTQKSESYSIIKIFDHLYLPASHPRYRIIGIKHDWDVGAVQVVHDNAICDEKGQVAQKAERIEEHQGVQ